MTGIPRFGFQTHVHSHAPARELLPALVDLYVAAEELGFESGWIAQHHLGSGVGKLPSPLVVLGAVAERTRSIRLGTTVVVLPLEDPVRLVEDAAVVDALSGGRLELGVGTGGPSIPEFGAFGRDPAERRVLYRRHLDRLLEVLSGQPLADGVRLDPDGSGVLRRIWEAPGSPERAAEVARDGHGIVLGIGTPQQQRELARAYVTALDGAEPRVGAFRGVFPGRDREERAQALWPDVSRFLESPEAKGWFPPDVGPHELLAALAVHYGTPGDIVGSVLADPTLPFATEYGFSVQAATTPISEAIRALEVVSAEVLPVIRAELAVRQVAA